MTALERRFTDATNQLEYPMEPARARRRGSRGCRFRHPVRAEADARRPGAAGPAIAASADGTRRAAARLCGDDAIAVDRPPSQSDEQDSAVLSATRSSPRVRHAPPWPARSDTAQRARTGATRRLRMLCVVVMHLTCTSRPTTRTDQDAAYTASRGSPTRRSRNRFQSARAIPARRVNSPWNSGALSASERPFDDAPAVATRAHADDDRELS